LTKYPIFTDVIECGKCMKEEPNKFVMNAIADRVFGHNKPEVSMLCLPNAYTLVLSSAKMAEEVLVKKNSKITKEPTI